MRLLKNSRRFNSSLKVILTDFTDLKGCGCKIPKDELLSYLSHFPQTKSDVFSTSPDCYVSKSPSGHYFASSIDFFYPLVDDAYLMGQITACNVLSDLYAAGVTNVDSFLVILGLSTKLSKETRKEVAIDLMRGMEDKVLEAKSKIVGGQTVHNPWVTIGGSVFGFFDKPEHVVRNTTAVAGDVILLTKPIGTQLLVNFNQYFRKDQEKRDKLESAGLTPQKLERISQEVCKSMITLNLYAAQAMNEVWAGLKACTDVTGFGLKGHSDNLVQIQTGKVDFLFERVPVFSGLQKYDKIVRDFRLKEGLAAETSGGLLMVVNKDAAAKIMEQLKKVNGQDSWIVGKVVEGSRTTVINEKTVFFDV